MSKIYIPLDVSMYQYMLSVSVREDASAQTLREYTDQHVEQSGMMTLPEQAQFLSLLVKLMQVKRAIEVGVYTGYSTLAIAKALPKNGELIACDIGEQWPSVGVPYWEKAGVRDKIQLKIAPAKNTLQQLIDDGQSGSFDFIYLDADKSSYDEYYEMGLKLLRKGGLIALDNMLYVGQMSVPEQSNPATKAIHALNNKLVKDERVDISMLPFGEGVMLARKT